MPPAAWGLFACVLVAAVMMITYSGRMETTDTRFLFDGTASLVRYGDFSMSLMFAEDRFWDFDRLPEGALPLKRLSAEPVQPLLAAPLYALARAVPGIGMVHTVWLFNIFVGVAVCAAMMWTARSLGYPPRVALAAGLLLGLGSPVWVYSRTFFQEPLTLLAVLGALGLFARARGRRWWAWLLLGVVVWGLGVLSRAAVVFTLPAMLLVVWPGFDAWLGGPRGRWWLLAMLLGVAGVLAWVMFGNGAAMLALLPATERYAPSLPTAPVALRAYLLSPGGSLWAAAPWALLALPGAWLWWRRGAGRWVLVLLAGVLGYAFGYAAYTSIHWFGGVSWPPRFLVPTLAFVMVAALPALDGLLRPPDGARRVGALALLGGLAFASAWVQLAGVSYWLGTYADLLPPQANRLFEWAGGLYDLRYVRWVLLPQQWGRLPLDFAWVRVGVAWWPWAFGALALLCAAGMVRRWRYQVALVLALAWVALTGLALVSIYDDPLYDGRVAALFAAERQLAAITTPEEIVVLQSSQFVPFFANHGKHVRARLVALPPHPGEQPSPEQPPLVTSPQPEALLERPSVQLLQWVAAHQQRLWLVTENGPCQAWAVRPVEWVLALHHYHVREIDVSGCEGVVVRLLAFDTARAPAVLAGPQTPTALVFGDSFALRGITAPRGGQAQPGDVLPLSLQWATERAPQADYTVALKLVHPQRGVVAEARDSAPLAGFMPTATWPAGWHQWDHRALLLPEDLPAGTYQLWVGVYTFEADGALRHLDVTAGDAALDGTFGVVPLEVTVPPSR